MQQFFRIRGYRVPWSPESDKRPIFSTIEKRNNFLLSLETFYIQPYHPNGANKALEFNPDQKTLVLPLPENTPASASRSSSKIMKSNYLRVDIGFSGVAEDYATYFYFIKNITVQPTWTQSRTASQSSSTGLLAYTNNAVAVAEIEIDPWLTYLPPSVPSAIMSKWTIIPQSTRGIMGMTSSEYDATMPFSSANVGANASPTGRRYTARAIGRASRFANRGINNVTTLSTCTYFVGIFAKEGGGAPLLLCRPYDITKPRTDPAFFSLEALTTIKSIAPSPSIDSDYTVSGSVELGGEIDVNLVRAFLIPKKCFQSDAVETGIQNAYVVTHTDVTIGRQLAGLRALRLNEFATFEEYVPFAPANVLDEGDESVASVGTVSFVDVGTLYNRLEVPPPSGSGDESTTLKFNGQVSVSGYSLVMTCGGRQIDLGGDFEIPVPTNPQLDALTRNKWSQALQGVTAVGGLVGGIATGNPVAAVGSALSVAEFVATTAEKASAVGTIQGQGNGSMLNSFNEYGETSPTGETCGFVYARYEFRTRQEVDLANRYGFVWNGGAYVYNPVTFGEAVFLNNGATRQYDRIFIKTINADICTTSEPFTWGLSKAGASLPADAKAKIEDIFNKGVTIYYDPRDGGTTATEGCFGY